MLTSYDYGLDAQPAKKGLETIVLGKGGWRPIVTQKLSKCVFSTGQNNLIEDQSSS